MKTETQEPYKRLSKKKLAENIGLTKLAHDLKGPLNSIKGLLHIASQDVDHEEAQRFFKLIEHYQQLLYYRINDLLNNVNLSEKKSTYNFLEQSQIFDSIRLPLHDLIGSNKPGVLQKPQKLSFKEKMNRVNDLSDILDMLQKNWSDKKSNKTGTINLVVLADDIVKSLNSIRVLLEIAIDEIENKTAIDYFELIEKSREQLFTRVEATLTKLHGDGITNPTRIDLTEMIDKVQSSLQNMEGFTNIKFQIQVKNNSPFYSDADALRSIIQNLLENAIKYRKQDSSRHTVSISIHDGNDGIVMKISDNGIGIKKEIVSKIFTFGVRDKNSSEEGHGIGLSLVKQLVEQLGGEIDIKSVNNQGTSFSLILPNAKHSLI
jgi:hypothetical protein